MGEMGFDFSKPIPPILQEKLFSAQLEVARSLPIVLHVRGHVTDTDGETVYNHCRNFLRNKVETNQAIQLHSFSGSEAQVVLWEQDFPYTYFSISGLVKWFTKSQIKGLKRIPLGKLLFETDSPYLSPSGGLNTPSRLREIIHIVSDIRGESFNELCIANRRNSKIMFNL